MTKKMEEIQKKLEELENRIKALETTIKDPHYFARMISEQLYDEMRGHAR